MTAQHGAVGEVLGKYVYLWFEPLQGRHRPSPCFFTVFDIKGNNYRLVVKIEYR